MGRLYHGEFTQRVPQRTGVPDSIRTWPAVSRRETTWGGTLGRIPGFAGSLQIAKAASIGAVRFRLCVLPPTPILGIDAAVDYPEFDFTRF